MLDCQPRETNAAMCVERERKQQLLLNKFLDLKAYLNQMVMGQEALTTRLLIAILTDGHLLVEGAPGLAKTRAIKALCAAIQSNFHRIQFTPDLLPADLTGTEVYRMETGSFEFQSGPLFHNLILADEINRAPAKVQSALLEAMAEKQITVGKMTYPLPKFFVVMATQNPIEQEGTYPLPEAQLDRFLLKVNVGYPDGKKEIDILNLVLNEAKLPGNELSYSRCKITQEDIFEARTAVLNVFMAPNIQQYIVQLILATRNFKLYGSDVADWIQYGASPRGTIALALAAKALAFLEGSDFVGPEHVQALAHDVLRHRIVMSYRREAEGITTDRCIDELLYRVPVP